jgi:hypothetical protein
MNYRIQTKIVVFVLTWIACLGYHVLVWVFGSTKTLCILDFSDDLPAGRR